MPGGGGSELSMSKINSGQLKTWGRLQAEGNGSSVTTKTVFRDKSKEITAVIARDNEDISRTQNSTTKVPLSTAHRRKTREILGRERPEIVRKKR